MSRILLLIDDLGQGGAERQMIYLALALKQAGNDIRLVKFYPGNSPYSGMLEKSGISIESLVSGKNRWRRILIIRNLVKKYHPDLTIVYKDGACIAACLAKILKKYKLAVSERNTTQKITNYSRFKFFCYRAADYIIPNSETQAKFIMNNYPQLRQKIRVITNAIDLNKFQPGDISAQNKRVVIAARLAPQKNVLRFLDALKIADLNPNDVHIDWYGKIHSQQYLEDIKQKIDSLGLRKIIAFHFEGCNDIQDEYRKATHFCLPSIYEGFPNALCEAMACGLICCASDVSDNSMILSDERFLFDPLNPADIANKLKRSLELNDIDRDIISKNNREKIEKMCSFETFTNKYLTLLSYSV